MNSLVPPLRYIQGAKKIMVVNTAKITGLTTIFVPLTAASKLASPVSVLKWMASPTMMASSTITPITKRKAKVEIMLKDTSKSGSNARPPAKAVAIPMLTQKAILGRRNNIRVKHTKSNPVKKFLAIVLMRPVYCSAASSHVVMDIPSGRLSLVSSK